MRITHLYHEIVFAFLRRKIKKHPYIGQEVGDGTHLYKKGIYGINYRITKFADGHLSIEWLSHRRRVTYYEEKIKRVRKGLFDFWLYQKWLLLFRPPIFFLLLVSILLFYFVAIETEEARINRVKLIVATASGISPDQIQYIGNGWLEISGERIRADKTREHIKLSFNPLRWFFFSEGGVLTRWRGEPYGYATHPLVINDKGDVWLKKKDIWVHGRFSDNVIKWDSPVGSGEVLTQELSIEDKRILIPDKGVGE